MSFTWYRQPRTFALDGTFTSGTEQLLSPDLCAYNTDTYLRNISPAYYLPTGPGEFRWLSEIKSVDSNGNDIETVYTRQLLVKKMGSGGTTTHEVWQNKWDNGAWVTQLEFDVPSEQSETTVINVNNYIWLDTGPPPGTYRSYQTYFINNAQQGPAVEEGVFEVRGLALANIGAECPFDPEEGPGALTADVYALPGSDDSYLFQGWAPTSSISWEFVGLDVFGTASVGSPSGDGKVASIAASWSGAPTMGINSLALHAIAGTSGGGNAYAAGVGFALLFHRRCPAAKAMGEASTTESIPMGSPCPLSLGYRSFDACRQPSSMGFGWSSLGSASLTEDLSGGLIYRDESGQTLRWTEDNGAYIPTRPDNYVEMESLGNPGPPFQLTFRNQSTRKFGADGKLLEESDRNGNTTTYTYSSGLLQTISDGRGGLLTYDYGTRTDGQPVSVRFGPPQTGRLVQFGYDTEDRLSQITDPAGDITEFEYDDSGRLARKTKVRPTRGNLVIEYFYDELGRLSETNYYDEWLERYTAYPPERYFGMTPNESHIGQLPLDNGIPGNDGRSLSYFWDDLGRTTGIFQNMTIFF